MKDKLTHRQQNGAPPGSPSRCQRRRESLEAAAEHLSDGIVRLDRHRRYLYVNPAFERIAGLSRRDCVGKTIAESGLSEQACRAWQETLDTIFDTARTARFRCRFFDHTQSFPVECVALAEPDGDGKPASALCIFRNPTADQVSENTRQLVDEQDGLLGSHAELLDLAHDTIIVHDLDGRITFWNKGAEKTYGWTQAEALGRISHNLLKTDFPVSLADIRHRLFEAGSWEGELLHSTRDGKQLTVESRWVLRRDDRGNPSAVLEIDRDITQRIAAEKQTREARKYAESIIETIQEALVVLGADLKVLSANHSFYRLFGLTPKGTEKRFIYELDQQQWNSPELRKLLEDILPQNTSFEEYEMKFVPSKGPPVYLLMNARRIYQDRKKTKMILLAIQDITPRVKHQKQIRDLTEQLLMAEEKQRQHIATALHDSIGQILAFSNRELAGLLKTTADPETARILEHVKNELSRAVRQSRELSADLSSATLHTFGLEAGIEELADRFSKQQQKDCRFTSGHIPELPEKIQLALYQAAKELLRNIIKHARADRVRIDLWVIDDVLQLSVADNGIGFDPAALPDIQQTGAGVGLFSIRQRLTNLGGSFTIESRNQNGTNIILRVPLPSAETTQKRSTQ